MLQDILQETPLDFGWAGSLMARGWEKMTERWREHHLDFDSVTEKVSQTP